MSVFLPAWTRLDSSLSLGGLIERLNSLIGRRVEIAPAGLGFPTRTITANRTVDGTDCIINADATAGAITVTIPRANQALGRLFRVKKIDATVNTVTIQASAGNIDGAGTKVLAAQYASTDLHAEAGNWWVY